MNADKNFCAKWVILMKKNKLLWLLLSVNFGWTSFAMDPPIEDRAIELEVKSSPILTLKSALRPFKKLQKSLDALAHYHTESFFEISQVVAPEEGYLDKIDGTITGYGRFYLHGESWELAIKQFTKDLNNARATLCRYVHELLDMDKIPPHEIQTAIAQLVTMKRMYQDAYPQVDNLLRDYNACRVFPDMLPRYPNMVRPLKALEDELDFGSLEMDAAIKGAVNKCGLVNLITAHIDKVKDNIFLDQILPKITSLENIKKGEIIDFNGQMFSPHGSTKKNNDIKSREIYAITEFCKIVLADLMKKFIAYNTELNDAEKVQRETLLRDTINYLNVFKQVEPKLYSSYNSHESGRSYFDLRQAFDVIFFAANSIESKITLERYKVKKSFCNCEDFSDEMWEERINAFTKLPLEPWSFKKSLSDRARKMAFNVSEAVGRLDHHDWMGRLDGNIVVLGALPYEEHLSPLLTLNIGAVLSIVENNENYTTGDGPITPQCWRENKVKQLQLAIGKSEAIKQNDIDLGVAFIMWNLKNKRGIYIHCGSGSGRGPLLFMCFLMRHRNYSMAEAYRFVVDRRPIAAFDNPNKKEALETYAKRVKEYFVRMPSAHDENSQRTWTVFSKNAK